MKSIPRERSTTIVALRMTVLTVGDKLLRVALTWVSMKPNDIIIINGMGIVQ